jgi:hypothetical protein
MLRNGTCEESSYWPFSVIESSVGELVRETSAFGRAAAFFPLKKSLIAMLVYGRSRDSFEVQDL